MSKVTDEMVQAFNIACWDQQRDHLPDLRAGIQALFDAKLISLPVDESAIRESVVRECIAALLRIVTNTIGGVGGADALRNRTIEDCHRALQSLLPTKDRAEALHKEWVDSDAYAFGDQSTYGFARWLIEREVVNG